MAGVKVGVERLAARKGRYMPVPHVFHYTQIYLNKVQPIKGFVSEQVSYSTAVSDTIEVVVVPRTGSPPRCSGCGRPGPTYDHAPQPRVWILPPLFKFALALVYTMRRVKCPTCGVLVEKVPWATGKHQLCDGFRLLLARWARHLSWDETADAFKVAWADVYASVQWVVEYGLAHRVLGSIQALGVNEVCVRVGRVFWTLIYQINKGMTRLLWVGHDRTEQTLLQGLDSLGTEVCAGIRFVCSDMWAPYLAAVKARLGALHILDRFHIRQQLNKAVDEVRREEARALAQAGLVPRLKRLRWALLKNPKNWTRSEHREVLLNYFRAKKAISGGVIEGLNNKVKVTFRKSYGFRTDKARKIALFHVLGKLPEPKLIHGFF